MSLAVALTRRGLASTIGRPGKYVRRASGSVLLIVGLYVVYYWGVPLFAPGTATEDKLIQYGEGLAGVLSGWFGGGVGQPIVYTLSALLAVTFPISA